MAAHQASILQNAVRESGGKNLPMLRQVAVLLKLTISIIPNEEGFSRILFKSEDDDTLYRFNGIVFDASGNIISYPVRRIINANTLIGSDNSYHDALQDIVNKYDYKVYYATNGTVVTLYYYANAWRLSSSRGIEIDEYVLIGNLTYRQIFDELLTIAQLDMICFEKNKCYSFVMSHPEYHILPFKTLVFLGGYDMITQKFFDVSAAPQFDKVKQEIKPIGKRETLIYRLREQAGESVRRYMEEHCNHDRSQPKLFGFVLRSKYPAVDYYVESDLMETMKLGAFSTYRIREGENNRAAYFILNIWLTGHNEAFWVHILGNKYESLCTEFHALLSNLCIHLYQIKNKFIHVDNIASRVYRDTIIYLDSENVIPENIRSIRYIDKYFAIWEEARMLQK